MSLCLCTVTNWTILGTCTYLHKYLFMIVTCHLLQHNLSISFLIQSNYLYLEIATMANPVINNHTIKRLRVPSLWRLINHKSQTIPNWTILFWNCKTLKISNSFRIMFSLIVIIIWIVSSLGSKRPNCKSNIKKTLSY